MMTKTLPQKGSRDITQRIASGIRVNTDRHIRRTTGETGIRRRTGAHHLMDHGVGGAVVKKASMVACKIAVLIFKPGPNIKKTRGPVRVVPIPPSRQKKGTHPNPEADPFSGHYRPRPSASPPVPQGQC